MLVITLLVAATGLVLGLRFNVFVLALLLLLAVLSVFAVVSWGGTFSGAALQLLVTVAAVQVAYFVGSLIAAQLPARDGPMSRTERRLYGTFQP
jgi:hypothetical protein